MKLFPAPFKRILPSDDLIMVNNHFQEKEKLKDTKGVMRNQHSAAWVHVNSVYTSTFLQYFLQLFFFTKQYFISLPENIVAALVNLNFFHAS